MVADTPESLPEQSTQTSTQPVSTTQHTGNPWLSGHLRNIMALSITGVVCYLALQGNDQAQAAIIATFAVLAGAIWGERAALRIPGRDS